MLVLVSTLGPSSSSSPFPVTLKRGIHFHQRQKHERKYKECIDQSGIYVIRLFCDEKRGDVKRVSR